MKYLILGGAGFIGTHLTNALQNDGHMVTVVDNCSTSANGSNADAFFRMDVRDCESLDCLFEYADVVYFLAGSVGVKNVIDNPYDTLLNNVNLASVVVRMAKKHNKPIIFTSTSEVYGEGPFHESATLSIGSPENLRWGYASAKLTTEFLIASSGCPYKILRLFNVTGPGQIGDYGMVLPRFVQAALRGTDIEVHGLGYQRRTFMHVSDAIDTIRRVEQLSTSDIYNIGSDAADCNVSIEELAYTVREVLNSTSNIVHRSLESVYPANSGDIVNRTPDMTRVRLMAGLNITKTLTDIILDIANDQLTH